MTAENDSAEVADRRSKIISAAAEVIAERGVDNTRLSDVAQGAGVSIGLLQHYFTNRNELLAQTFQELLERDVREWRDMVEGERDPLRRLVLLLRWSCDSRGYSEEFEREPDTAGFRIWVEHWAVASRHRDLLRQSGAIYEGWGHVFQETIEDGAEQGVFAPTARVDDVVDRLLAVGDGLSVRVVLGHMTVERMYELLLGAASTELGVTIDAPLYD